MSNAIPVLTIAGSDPSGGAGLQADLKTFHQFGTYGMSVVTLLTVQNTQGVERVDCCDPDLVAAQFHAIIKDIPPCAAKTGALGNKGIIACVADLAPMLKCPLVVDPVMISKHGATLLAEDAVATLIDKLLPHAFLVTPNISEAEALSGCKIDDDESALTAAARIADLGPRYVLIKGGHRDGDPRDVLYGPERSEIYEGKRIDTKNTHGTGCVTSAAITACLGKGMTIYQAVACAKQFITKAISSNPDLGHGYGPTNMHTRIEE